MDDDYDLVPHHEVQQLKKDMEKIKSGEFPGSHDLLANLKELNDSLRMMTSLLKEAAESIKVDDSHQTSKKLDTVVEQNTKIAEGIVALADLVKEKAAPVKQPRPIKAKPPQPRPFPTGPLPKPKVMEPRPSSSPPPDFGAPPQRMDHDVPPMPSFDLPGPAKPKKGFLGLFKK